MSRHLLILANDAVRQRRKSCAHYGVQFTKDLRLSWKQWAERLYCSQACSGSANEERMDRKREPLRDKFNTRFKKTDGCWEWNGTRDGFGYGLFDYKGKRYRAHSLALVLAGHTPRDGEVACHKCDNPKCVRPDHLYFGTARDNVHDAMNRGRLPKGERHGQAKLTEDQVYQIRQASGSYTAIANQFGLSRASVTRIIKGKNWRHLP